ncbi:hypothetical protein M378DRAFT_170920 [Amanita muscaria Koide BX008]|uniref:Uncharacterized protein n=1 Tax=Amanita muscaria (strain Koide BX008) TaxID=946122 RepID=A0A0C2WPL3_AMAMK|nr:hypothetical protein M378DRAFT_173492 [Amanita muscaria Koide BX008]KIL58193.1 hypothetical protein M378DRAFT_170920 [Amanita muscaria Koide BX008]
MWTLDWCWTASSPQRVKRNLEKRPSRLLVALRGNEYDDPPVLRSRRRDGDMWLEACQLFNIMSKLAKHTQISSKSG